MLNKNQKTLEELINKYSNDWEYWYPKYSSCNEVLFVDDLWCWINDEGNFEDLKKEYKGDLTEAMLDAVRILKDIYDNYYDSTANAINFLKKQGLCVDSLWNIEDVKSIFHCSDKKAHIVMAKALENDATTDQIWFALNFEAEEMGLKKYIPMFSISGYWKDDKSEFCEYLVHEYDDCPDGVDDDNIFYFGLSEHNIQDAIKEVENNALEFVITGYEPYKYILA